jgi:linoleate 10R-lipoxygenase
VVFELFLIFCLPDLRPQGAFLDTAINPDAVDDRKGAVSIVVSVQPSLLTWRTTQFADGLTLLSRMPPGSDVSKQMSNSAITLLYNTIPHVRRISSEMSRV